MKRREGTNVSDNHGTEFLVRASVGSAIARPRTFLNVVLDKSSSMGCVRLPTIAAVNAFLEAQRSDRVDELFVTQTQFSDRSKIKVAYTAKPIADVRPLTPESYLPEGMTALYDGVYRTLLAMEKRVGTQARVLTVVITDGDDNSSVEVRDAAALKRIIDQYQQLGNWTFVFMAAGAEAYHSGVAMGFPPGNVQTYSVEHVGEALATVARGVTAYRHSDALQTDKFYTARKFRRTQWAQNGDPDCGVE
jgi:hypothetical protein